MFKHEGYIEAATSRARSKLGTIEGVSWGERWLFVALEINKEIAKDRLPRPVPPDDVVPIQYLLQDLPQRDCVQIAKFRENWFRKGGPVGVLP